MDPLSREELDQDGHEDVVGRVLILTREQPDADGAACRHFDAFSCSAKRAILEWIAAAERPETRQRRIARTVECAAQNRRLEGAAG